MLCCWISQQILENRRKRAMWISHKKRHLLRLLSQSTGSLYRHWCWLYTTITQCEKIDRENTKRTLRATIQVWQFTVYMYYGVFNMFVCFFIVCVSLMIRYICFIGSRLQMTFKMRIRIIFQRNRCQLLHKIYVNDNWIDCNRMNNILFQSYFVRFGRQKIKKNWILSGKCIKSNPNGIWN